MRRLLTTLLCLLALMAGPAFAREQSDAPEIEIIGFSADGRYFAYEQYGYDLASDALNAAVFVIDRRTNAVVEGFPFGFLPFERDGEYPARVGGHDIDLDAAQTDEGLPDLARVRKLVRDKAAAKLAGLGIAVQGRRLAGIALTQRSPASAAASPLKFVVWPTIPSAIPDQQFVYSIDAKTTDPLPDCVNAAPEPRDIPVTFTITAERTFPETKTVAKKDHAYDWAIDKDDCPVALRITDIIAPPDAAQAKPVLVVVFMTIAWSSAVDSADYHATFIEMPEGE